MQPILNAATTLFSTGTSEEQALATGVQSPKARMLARQSSSSGEETLISKRRCIEIAEEKTIDLDDCIILDDDEMPAADWYLIGIMLGFKNEVLSGIKIDHADCADRWQALVIKAQKKDMLTVEQMVTAFIKAFGLENCRTTDFANYYNYTLPPTPPSLDIEKDPSRGELTLQDAYRLVRSKTHHWKSFGLHLGVDSDTRDKILEKHRKDPDMACLEMLEKRLEAAPLKAKDLLYVIDLEDPAFALNKTRFLQGLGVLI